MKRALLIAYHYPPARGSSGLQRTLKYSRYLRDSGWYCDVLTVALIKWAKFRLTLP
jgi:hypothetical protein